MHKGIVCTAAKQASVRADDMQRGRVLLQCLLRILSRARRGVHRGVLRERAKVREDDVQDWGEVL